MPETPYTNEFSENGTRVFQWANVTEADTFQRIDLGGLHGDVTIIARGNFGTGGDVTLEGSHDGTNWYAVNDPAGSPISLTAEGYAAARDVFPYMRPALSAGTGVDVTVTVAVTRA